MIGGMRTAACPKVSFSTALAGSFEHLKAGDYLIFDGGRNQRDVVRLTEAPEIVEIDARSATSPPSSVILTVITWGTKYSAHP